ncbi:MAG: RNA polymerase sigma factor [Bacteroidales bacterium]|nr:RNA polymerase sigma factor [Bacteroidales bacterium]
MKNKELVEACKKQDPNAQRELYETYAPRMMALCMMYCKDSDAAQDMLHDGFIKVFTQIKKYSARGSFEGWMRRVFVNTILEHFRKEKRRFQIFSEMEETQEGVMDENLERLFDDSITEETLLEMIQELPDGYRTVFNLYVFEDFSHREIGKKLGIKEAASRSQYSRAKSSLKNKINEYIANNNE